MKLTAVERLKAGERIIGTMVRMVRNTSIASLAKFGGLDFIMLDMEHGSYTIENAEDIAKVARASNVGIFARVPELARSYVSRLMDAGVEGIMVPMVNNADEAQKLVDWSRYAPLGKRGLGTNGGLTEYQGIGTDAMTFMASQNKKTLAIAQIETAQAIENIEDIAAVEGIDVLLIGPNDLSISLGVPGKLFDPLVQDAILKVAECAARNNKVFSMHAGDALLDIYKDRMQMIMNSIDIDVIGQGFSAISKKYRK
ncbi:hypothetical protein EXM22_16335 [Oceanispirochaeta crateris]|uniref:HpcH/HpaI aldolase/citrate lyase domain-containing protein n=1 Tax=Oceanispirochaeta crateris TaxID=2518645 RepID=A0A5C1QNE5_9SPIO|nr:aldolase/citrate lyase family protein [Oceanispirochaeta crateris]QEN09473.1 hypothetical protein EXM22_16335 [Oceanispirochaeta crateris]